MKAHSHTQHKHAELWVLLSRINLQYCTTNICAAKGKKAKCKKYFKNQLNSTSPDGKVSKPTPPNSTNKKNALDKCTGSTCPLGLILIWQHDSPIQLFRGSLLCLRAHRQNLGSSCFLKCVDFDIPARAALFCYQPSACRQRIDERR